MRGWNEVSVGEQPLRTDDVGGVYALAQKSPEASASGLPFPSALPLEHLWPGLTKWVQPGLALGELALVSYLAVFLWPARGCIQPGGASRGEGTAVTLKKEASQG